MDQSLDQSTNPLQDTQAPAASCPSCESYLAGWKRAQADYQNLKREVERERAEMTKYANQRLLADLLPAIDQFALALHFMPEVSSLSEASREAWENWLKGLRAVQSLWDQVAKDVGLEHIPTDGSFDPFLHEAAGEDTVEGQVSGTIASVLQAGWRLHGKVLRPARVIVAK
jgi:molecular chaperone GrpE